jgi:hypothetical protein
MRARLRWRGHLPLLRARTENSRGAKQIPAGKTVGHHPVGSCSLRLAVLEALTRFRAGVEISLVSECSESFAGTFGKNHWAPPGVAGSRKVENSGAERGERLQGSPPANRPQCLPFAAFCCYLVPGHADNAGKSANVLKEIRKCDTSTPCCACVISMPR